MNLLKKIKWFLAVLGVFLLILTTNVADKKYFVQVEESVDKIYNERLLAKELLLDVSIKFHKKELAYALNDKTYLQNSNDAINAEISESLKMFDRAKSSKKEDIIIKELNQNHTRLIDLESKSLSTDSLYSKDCAAIFSAINLNIVELSAEQVKEGKNQKFLAREAVETANLFSKIEIFILVFIGLVLLIFIVFTPSSD